MVGQTWIVIFENKMFQTRTHCFTLITARSVATVAVSSSTGLNSKKEKDLNSNANQVRLKKSALIHFQDTVKPMHKNRTWNPNSSVAVMYKIEFSFVFQFTKT